MKRVLSLWFPNWPIQHLRKRQAELSGREILLTETVRGRELVRFCCERSQTAGVRVGMPLAEAASYLPNSAKTYVGPLANELHPSGLERLADWCGRYSPRVGLEEHAPPEGLLLDLSGLGQLYASEHSLAGDILKEIRAQQFSVRIGVGDTVSIAWAAARFLAEAEKPAIIPSGQIQPLLSVPVRGLRLDPAALEKLHKLGVKTVQQMLRLDRSALKARFGNELLIRLEQFTGERGEAITPYRPPPRFLARRRFEHGTTRSRDVEELARLLLRQVVEQLQSRYLGTRNLSCKLITEDGRGQTISLRLQSASGEFSHLQELLRLHFERVRLESPLVGMEMEARETAPLKWTAWQLFEGESQAEARELSALKDRLTNRLGERAVVSGSPGHDPVPERSLEFVPIMAFAASAEISAHEKYLPLDRPLCLLPTPEPIEVVAVVPEGPPSAVFWDGAKSAVVSYWGPERIETAWWRGPSVRRDYYRIELETGQRLWLYRDIARRNWFLHGTMF